MAEVGFREASGRAKTALLLALVAMVLLLLASAVLVFFVTVLGVGSCSSDACTSRATVAVLGSLVLHAVAIGVAVCLVLRRMATLPRVLMLVLLAVGVPVGTFFGSFLLVSSGQG